MFSRGREDTKLVSSRGWCCLGKGGRLLVVSIDVSSAIEQCRVADGVVLCISDDILYSYMALMYL